MTDQILTGTCHCGTVEWQATIGPDWDGRTETLPAYLCNCSLCRRKQQITAVVPLDKLTVVKGADNLTTYQWNKGIAKHYFCKTCGVYTHHQRRSDPNTYGLNLTCVDSIDLDALVIGSIDGKSFD